MLELLHYSFMVRALLAGLVIAITLPVLGSFLVARRYSLIADSLAHVSLAGVGAGLFFGLSPLQIAIPVTVAGAFLLEWLRQKQHISGEISLAILTSGGLAVALVLANLSRGTGANFDSYLFGSITTTTSSDIVLLACAAILVLVTIVSKYHTFLHITFNEDSARIAGYRVNILNYVLVGLTAVIVALSLRVVGGLLIGALLVIPVVTASRLTNSFMKTILVAVALAVITMIAGIVTAFYVGIAAGGAIVFAALILLGVVMFWKR